MGHDACGIRWDRPSRLSQDRQGPPRSLRLETRREKAASGRPFLFGAYAYGQNCGRALRDNVRGELVFESRDLIAQQELSLLQPLHLQLVDRASVSQGLDRRVEVAVLLAQALDLGDQRRMVLRREPLLIHSPPLYASRPEASTLSHAPGARSWARKHAFRTGVALSP